MAQGELLAIDRQNVRKQLLPCCCFALAISAAWRAEARQATRLPPNDKAKWTDQQKAEMAASVRQEFLHAWNGYRQYAWGHDELVR